MKTPVYKSIITKKVEQDLKAINESLIRLRALRLSREEKV